jgi:hypothetical protein
MDVARAVATVVELVEVGRQWTRVDAVQVVVAAGVCIATITR